MMIVAIAKVQYYDVFFLRLYFCIRYLWNCQKGICSMSVASVYLCKYNEGVCAYAHIYACVYIYMCVYISFPKAIETDDNKKLIMVYTNFSTDLFALTYTRARARAHTFLYPYIYYIISNWDLRSTDLNTDRFLFKFSTIPDSTIKSAIKTIFDGILCLWSN